MDVDILEVLQTKFPDMQPICSAPSMHTVNGIGTRLYGERDRDRETGAYVSTLCFCIVFIPVYALSAYVVTDGKGGGWHFFGSVPLSQTARDRNKVSIIGFLTLIFFVCLGAFFNSAGWEAYGRLGRARALAEAGNWKEAGQTYEIVAGSGTWASSMAHSDLEKHVFSKLGKKDIAGLAEAAQALFASHLMEETINTEGQSLKEKLVALAVANQETQPVETALLLSVVMSYSAPEDRKALEYPFAISLSAAIERDEERVIAFCDQQFGRFKTLMDAFNAAFKKGVDRFINILQHGHRKDFDYNRFEVADDATKSAMIEQWVTPKVIELENVSRLRFSVVLAGAACGLALDCTELLYRQVKDLPEENMKRIRTIRRCQHLFGTVGEYVEDVPVYLVQYAEVCHLMGKEKRAQQVFSKIINDRETTPELLVEVAEAKNKLEMKADARKIAERAYDRAENKEERSNAAGVRADATDNLEEAVAWLKRCDPEDKSRKAQLFIVLGKVARKKGEYDESRIHFQKAFELLETDDKDFLAGLKACSTALDICETLYAKEDFDKAFAFIEGKAKEMPKFFAIQMLYARVLQMRALYTVIGDELDFALLKDLPRYEFIEFLVRRQRDKDKYNSELANNADWSKSIEVLDKLVTQSPKSVIGWRWLVHSLYKIGNKEALKPIVEKLEVYRPTLETNKEEIKELEAFILGKKGPEKDKPPRTLRIKGKGRKSDAARALAVRESSLPINTRVRLAKKLVSRSPSEYTMDLYLDLLFEKAHVELMKESSDYKKAVRPGLNHLSFRQLLAQGLISSRASMAAVQASETFDTGRILLGKFLKGFPKSNLPSAWIFFRQKDKAKSAEIAQRMKDDELLKILRKVDPFLYGHLDRTIFAHYLNDMAINDRDGARRFGGKLRKRGYDVQLPGKGK